MSEPFSTQVLLITGGCGYLGSQLIRDLAEDPRYVGSTIRVLDNMQYGDYRAIINLSGPVRFEFVEGDIMDPVVVRRALHGVSTIIHLAAIVKTPLSFDHPTWTKQVNHWGTARLVEHCLEAGVSRFVFASSASVYGPGGPYGEEVECRPIGPYAEAKLRAEHVVMAAAERGLQPTVLRLATFFGDAPTMRFLSVTNRLAYLAGVGRPVTVFGNGEQLRPVLHVHDASEAIRFCLAHHAETNCQLFNVVSQNISILDLVDVIRRIVPDVRVHFTEQNMLTHFSFAVSGDKFRAVGWEPTRPLEEGIGEVIRQFDKIDGLPHQALAGVDEF